MNEQNKNLPPVSIDVDLMLARSGVNKVLEEIEALKVCLSNITDLLAAERAPANPFYRAIKKYLPHVRKNRRKVYEALQDCNRGLRVGNSILNDITDNLNEKNYPLPRIIVAEKNYRNPVNGELMHVPDLVPLQKMCEAYKEQIEILCTRSSPAKKNFPRQASPAKKTNHSRNPPSRANYAAPQDSHQRW